MAMVLLGALGGWRTLEPEQMLTTTGGYFHGVISTSCAQAERTRIPQQCTSTRSITEKQRIARCAREASRKRRLVGSDDAVTFILI